MENLKPASSTIIPTVDLAPFMDGGDEALQKSVRDTISEAITYLGVFQVKNCGVAREHCEKLLTLNKQFFGYSTEEKKAATAIDSDMSGAGYGEMSDITYYNYEYLLMYNPDKPYNGVPTIQTEYRETYEAVFKYYIKISQILEDIINDCLGLPKNFLKTFNDDRDWDYLLPMHYAKSHPHDTLGIVQHQDPNLFTIILQGNTSGLEFLHDREWIPIFPTTSKLVVIMSDLLMALANKKIRHVTHRALKNKENKRLAIDFVHTLGPNKFVEPLCEHSKQLGEIPFYRRFQNKAYIDLITKNYTHPPANLDEFIHLSYYENKYEM